MSIKSNKNSLKKMNAIAYPRLSPHERFKKFIKAYAENNERQCEKLSDSCPRFTYLESDRTYTDRIQASSDITSVFLLSLLEYDKVITLYKLDIVVNNKQKILSEIYGFLLAFDEFCINVMGLDLEQLILAWYGYDDKYIQMLNKIEDYLVIKQVKPDEEVKRQWLNFVLKHTWECRIKGQI